MFPATQVLDRGRLVIGILLVAPLGALVPAAARPQADKPLWAIAATTPNPITPPTAQEVLASLTNPTVSPEDDASRKASPSAPVDEVGSESSEDPAAGQALQIPGTAPEADLAAALRQSQSRFAPPAPATPAASPSEGPTPFATPLTAAYPIPQGASHVFPVVGGARYSNDWGGPRPGGRRHQGIDLFAGTGTPVVAISDGTLFRVGWNRVGGWRFWLRDRWGNEFYHAHLSAFAPTATEGALVRAGTVIGFVGSTGDARTTPPHLHFEIHPGGGGPIPPFSYVSGWPRL